MDERLRDGSGCCQDDGRYLLEFDDGQGFSFDPDNRVVSCPPQLDSTTRHQLLDHVLPRVLEHLGHLMIHAGAVCTPHGVIIFVGDTGAGKSSLVASFHTAGRRPPVRRLRATDRGRRWRRRVHRDLPKPATVAGQRRGARWRRAVRAGVSGQRQAPAAVVRSARRCTRRTSPPSACSHPTNTTRTR